MHVHINRIGVSETLHNALSATCSLPDPQVSDRLKKSLLVPYPFARFLGEWVGSHELNKCETRRPEA